MTDDRPQVPGGDSPLHGVALARKVLEDSLRANKENAQKRAQALEAQREIDRIETERAREALEEIRDALNEPEVEA